MSSSWYRVARLQPALRGHVQVRIHRYQKKIWYVLQDDLNNQTHRLGAAAYQIVSLMDGRRDLHALWLETAQRMGDAAPTQDDVIRLLARLHNSELLQTNMPPDARELVTRIEQKRRSKVLQMLTNPMSLKFPIWDPDAFLDRTNKWVRWLFTRFGALIWLIVIGQALLLAGSHWTDLTAASSDHILAASNLPLLTIAFLGIKLVHELGHGYAVKVLGGAVHELGLMLLVFFPSPYVDASASIQLRDKWQRALVGAAGMLTELFIAAIALDVWLLVEPGNVRAIAFNITVVASVSTLLFNGNPLLRYDGYYILTDVIEVPNLAARANSYWGYLVDRYILSVPALVSPAESEWERFWLAAYAPASFFYRQIVMIGIALYIANEYLIVGVVMALWSIASGVVLPIWRAIRNLATNPKYGRSRPQTIRRVALIVGGAALFLIVVPMPLHTRAEGVVWLPESAIVRAGADGFIDRLALPDGSAVQRNTVLTQAHDPELTAEIGRLRGRVEELEVQEAIDRETDRVHERLTEIELAQARASLARQLDRADGLTTRANVDGLLIRAKPEELSGGYARQGEILAFVVPPASLIVRATVDQDDIGLVRDSGGKVRVLMASDPRIAYDASVIREVPAADTELPSRALGVQGGGAVAVDPQDPQRTRAIKRLFQLDLRLPADAPTSALGSRVYVRFTHRWEPPAEQIFRRFRQLLLARLNA
ncbi:HlyD family efflux transporter periplasmic adaptor subunit [Sphingomonas sp. MMS24-J13]|uniref:HlyD family efflux transporter periplasmic adaptor subunit n=1 Tax=Sphingomonas sp. MMS24-J13 TaxID=3238686 RepID=UPI00384E3812